jgi:hypothetical protein
MTSLKRFQNKNIAVLLNGDETDWIAGFYSIGVPHLRMRYKVMFCYSFVVKTQEWLN